MFVLASKLTDDLIVAGVSLLLAASVGSLLAYIWDDLRRRREGDLAALETFYRTYGEFFATWKLWEAHRRYRHARWSDPEAVLLERRGGG